jgi:hypothetical protein
MPHRLPDSWRHRPPLLRYVSVALGMASVLLAGCGRDGVPRHVVTGNVTFQGQPVEYGTIVFEPEASVGRIAPRGMARVENGYFRTDREESPTTGAYKVRVFGFDKARMKQNPEPGEIVDTPELFPEYTFQVQIPPPDGRLDVQVPESGQKGDRPVR